MLGDHVVYTQKKGIAVSSLKFIVLRARVVCFVAEFARICLLTLAWLPVLVLPMLLLDWALVLSSGTREVLRLLLPVYLAAGLLYSIVAARRVARNLPTELDTLNHDARSTISSALSIPAPASEGLGAWLARQSAQDATEAVLQANTHHPALRRWGKGLLWVLVAAFAVMGAHTASPLAFNVLGGRLLTPNADIPPYSSLVFEITPAAPEVHYGEDLPLSCRISGAENIGEVVMLLRAEGVPEQTLPIFCDNKGNYTRVLEKVTSPCSVAFATADGRARSRFVPVRVNYSPRILSGSAIITPLSYTGEEPQKVTLGGSEIRVPDGGSVTFSLRCSMPIAGGEGLFTATGAREPVRVEGVVSGSSFELTMQVRSPGVLEMQVFDANGRSSDSPVRTRLAVLPDTPPSVAITSPEDGAYVVEGFPLDVLVEAADDYGISRLTLYKALAPYRQHGLPEDMSGRPRSSRIKRSFNTLALGFRAGDTIELRAEVGDDNPFRYSIVSTPTTKVKVISGAEYAAIMRMQLSYKAFIARYEAMQQALLDADRALEAAENADSPQAREAARAAAMKSLAEAQKLAQSIASDFPAFDMDGQLSQLAGQIADNLQQQQHSLSQLNTSMAQAEWQQSVQRIRAALQPQNQQLADQTQEARSVELLARLHELQQRFMTLAEQQNDFADLLQRFKQEFGAPVTSQPSRLEGLGQEQSSIADAYRTWLHDVHTLTAEADGIPQLAKAVELLKRISVACERARVEELMEQCVGASASHSSAEAAAAARMAADAMNELLKSELSEQSCQDAQSQCRNQLSQNALNTLSQMCNNMGTGNRKGTGNSKGKGATGGGTGFGTSDGTPGEQGQKLIGPGRADMPGRKASQPGRSPRPGKAGQSASQYGDSPAADAASSSRPDDQNYSGVNTEQVPPAYRDAVRSYFKR